jgi:hypothetical protein
VANLATLIANLIQYIHIPGITTVIIGMRAFINSKSPMLDIVDFQVRVLVYMLAIWGSEVEDIEARRMGVRRDTLHWASHYSDVIFDNEQFEAQALTEKSTISILVTAWR